MAQVTIYLDDDTKTKLEQAAKAAGVPTSRWLADLIRVKTANEWPPSIAALAGSWADMPTADEHRADLGEDVPRESI